MNFGKNDLAIIFILTMAVVSMSFLFPALGLGGNKVSESEIPSFDIEPNRFDFSGDFPNRFDALASGELIWDNDSPNNESEEYISSNPNYEISVQLRDAADGSVWVDLVNYSSPSNIVIRSAKLNTSSVQNEQVTLSTNNDDKWVTKFSLIEFKPGQDEYKVKYEVFTGSGGYQSDGIRGVIGSVVDAIVYVAKVFLWFMTVLFEIILNVFAISFDVISSFIEFMAWLIETYTSIVSNAPGWASVIVALPGVLLTLEFMKLIMIAVEIIWIG